MNPVESIIRSKLKSLRDFRARQKIALSLRAKNQIRNKIGYQPKTTAHYKRTRKYKDYIKNRQPRIGEEVRNVNWDRLKTVGGISSRVAPIALASYFAGRHEKDIRSAFTPSRKKKQQTESANKVLNANNINKLLKSLEG